MFGAIIRHQFFLILYNFIFILLLVNRVCFCFAYSCFSFGICVCGDLTRLGGFTIHYFDNI